MNTSLSQYLVANELVGYQEKSVLRESMIIIFENALSKPNFKADQLNDLGLSKIIKKQTGLTVEFLSNGLPDVDLGVSIPPVSRNQVLRQDIMRETGEYIKFEMIKKAVNDLNATINLKTGKVSGVFSAFHCPIFIGDGYFSERPPFTAAEISAMVLHELGHIFYYCLFLIESVRVNLVLSALNRSNFYDCDRTKKIKFMDEIEKGADIKIRDKESLATASKEVVHSVLIVSTMERIRSETRASMFDERAFEFLADHFATMHGAGSDLATSISKLNRLYDRLVEYKRDQRLSNILSITSELVSSFVSLIFFAWIGINTVNTDNRYDPPLRRLSKIKEQLVSQLRKRNSSSAMKKALIADIEIIEELMESDRETVKFGEFFYYSVIPWIRKGKKVAELQHDYEALAFNPLYKTSAQLTA